MPMNSLILYCIQTLKKIIIKEITFSDMLTTTMHVCTCTFSLALKELANFSEFNNINHFTTAVLFHCTNIL